MTEKLTLSADIEVIRKAKRLAMEQKTSVSKLFGRFVQSVTNNKASSRPIGFLTQKATGVIRLPSGKSDRQLLELALLEKYALKK